MLLVRIADTRFNPSRSHCLQLHQWNNLTSYSIFFLHDSDGLRNTVGSCHKCWNIHYLILSTPYKQMHLLHNLRPHTAQSFSSKSFHSKPDPNLINCPSKCFEPNQALPHSSLFSDSQQEDEDCLRMLICRNTIHAVPERSPSGLGETNHGICISYVCTPYTGRKDPYTCSAPPSITSSE